MTAGIETLQAIVDTDDGAGFDTRAARHLFGGFQRMHPADRLGRDGVERATAQRLVLRHGGRVWPEAETEKGATRTTR
jgi:light-regulated signal transduction histidine kinase (bacteriophytochrome)